MRIVQIGLTSGGVVYLLPGTIVHKFALNIDDHSLVLWAATEKPAVKISIKLTGETVLLSLRSFTISDTSLLDLFPMARRQLLHGQLTWSDQAVVDMGGNS